jgi:hypothetical protein
MSFSAWSGGGEGGGWCGWALDMVRGSGPGHTARGLGDQEPAQRTKSRATQASHAVATAIKILIRRPSPLDSAGIAV